MSSDVLELRVRPAARRSVELHMTEDYAYALADAVRFAVEEQAERLSCYDRLSPEEFMQLPDAEREAYGHWQQLQDIVHALRSY